VASSGVPARLIDAIDGTRRKVMLRWPGRVRPV